MVLSKLSHESVSDILLSERAKWYRKIFGWFCETMDCIYVTKIIIRDGRLPETKGSTIIKHISFLGHHFSLIIAYQMLKCI